MSNMIPLIFIATLVANEPLIQQARTFHNSGVVHQHGTYTYLKITDNYIHELYDLLHTSYNIAKPDYFSATKSAGAHITIAYGEENILLSQKDLELSHSFNIENLYHVILGNKGYFILAVSCPSLEKLREKYGLPKKPCYKGHAIVFHITIACYPV